MSGASKSFVSALTFSKISDFIFAAIIFGRMHTAFMHFTNVYDVLVLKNKLQIRRKAVPGDSKRQNPKF